MANAIITPPKVPIEIGHVTIDGTNYKVTQSGEFVRFFFDLFRRVGGFDALSNTELEKLASDAFNAGTADDPVAREALRGVDELRNELASTRAELQSLRTLLDAREAEFAALLLPSDLTARVQQIEDRLQ
jgi:hypothetical protein